MRTKTAIYGLILLLLMLVLNSCAGTKKTRCSCPNFRGSRAIYGKVEIPNSKYNTLEVEVDNAVDLRLTTYDF